MRRALLVITVIIAVVAQISLIPALRPFGVVPNSMIGLVTIIGLRATVSEALIIALGGGIIMDFTSGASFGLYTGILVLAALGTGLIRRAGLADGSLIAAFVVAGAATIIEAIFEVAALGSALVNGPLSVLVITFITELVLNLVITLIWRPLIYSLIPSDQAVSIIG